MGVGRTKAPLHSFPPLPLPKLLPHKPKPKQLASSVSFLVGLLLACLLVRCFLSPSAPCPSLSVCFIGLGVRDIGGGEEARGGCFVFLRSHVPWRQAVVPQGVSQGPWSWYPPCQHPVIFYSIFFCFLCFLNSGRSPLLLWFYRKKCRVEKACLFPLLILFGSCSIHLLMDRWILHLSFFRAHAIHRAYGGACVQMRLSYSSMAPIILNLIQWMDCSCSLSYTLPSYLGLLEVLVYKVLNCPWQESSWIHELVIFTDSECWHGLCWTYRFMLMKMPLYPP